jgi:hypothetical protein
MLGYQSGDGDDSEIVDVHGIERLWETHQQLQGGDGSEEPGEVFERDEEEAIRTNAEIDFYKTQSTLTHVPYIIPLQQVLPSSLHTLITESSDDVVIFAFLNFARFLKHSKQEMYPYLRHWIDISWDFILEDRKDELVTGLAEVGVQFEKIDPMGDPELPQYQCMGQCDQKGAL